MQSMRCNLSPLLRHCELTTVSVAIHLYVFSGSPQSLSLLRDDGSKGVQPRDDESGDVCDDGDLVLQPHDYEEEIIYGCSSTDIQYNYVNAKLVILK